MNYERHDSGLWVPEYQRGRVVTLSRFGVLGPGGGSPYLVFEHFDGSGVPAGWSKVDTESKISFANSLLSFSGGKATPVHGDPALVWTAGIQRRAGLTLEVKAKSVASGASAHGPYFILSNVLAYNNISTQVEHGQIFDADWLLAYRLGTATVSGLGYSANTWKYLRIVLESTGALYYASSDGVTWSLIWEDTTGSVATLFPVLYSYNAACDVDYVRWWQGSVKAPIVNDTFDAWSGWTDMQGTWRASGGVANSATDNSANLTVRTGLVADGIFRVTMSGLTAQAVNYRIPSFLFRYNDVNTHLLAQILNGALELWKNDNGWTRLAQVAQAVADGVAYVLDAVCVGNSVQIYVNGTNKINYTLAGGDVKYAGYTGLGLKLAKNGSPEATPATWDNLKVQAA